jgi:predicted phosphodiesterase
MSKILILPDIHGRDFWKDAVNKEEYDEIVFLGDYVDPYPDEFRGLNPTQLTDNTISNLHEIIEWAKDKSNVTFLLGNHDLHYINQTFYDYAGGTRYNRRYDKEINDFYNEMKDKIKICRIFEDNGKKFILSHSGVTRFWYNQTKELIGDFNEENINKLLDSYDGMVALAMVGRIRGGFALRGSIVWADLREHIFENDEKDENPMKKYFQIFAHTRLQSKPFITDTFACIDVGKPFVLDNGELKEIDM